MYNDSKTETFCQFGFLAALSFVLLVSPLARVQNDPLGLVKWFVACLGAFAMLAFLVSTWGAAGRIRIYSSPLLLPLLLMVCLSAVSLIWTAPRFQSDIRMRRILLSWAPFFLCLLAPISQRMRRIAALSLVAGVSICSAIGASQFFGLFRTSWSKLPWEHELGKRVFSTMWNPNFLAGLLILTLPVILALARTSTRQLFKITLISLYYLNFLCLVFTNSWGGWAGWVASLIFLVVAGRWRTARTQPRTAGNHTGGWAAQRFVLIVLCAATVAIFFAFKGKTVAGSTVGASERVKMWRSAMMVIRRHPFGVGVGNFAVFENKFEHLFIKPTQAAPADYYQDRDSLLHNSLYCHNEFLETALETGVVGLVLLLWLMLTVGRIPFGRGKARMKSKDRHDPRPSGSANRHREAAPRYARGPHLADGSLMITAVAAGATAVFVQSIVSYPLRVPTTVTSLAALLGLFTPRSKWFELEFSAPKALKFTVLGAAIIGATFACLHGYRPLEAESHYVKGMQYLLSKKDYAAASAEYRKAIALGLPRFDIYFWLGEAQLKVGRNERALETYRRALEIQPYHEYSYFGIAEALRGLGRTDEAIGNYEKSIEYEPRFLDAYLHLAKLYRSRGEPRKAVETLGAGLKYFPKAREMKLDRAIALVQLGQITKARSDLQKLLKGNPNDAVVGYDLGILAHAEDGKGLRKPSALADSMIDSQSAKWVITVARMGAVFLHERKFEAARREFEVILNRFPGYPPALANIGTTYFISGDAARAEVFFLRAVRLAPGRYSYRAALAEIYASQGRFQAAEEQLLKAHQIAPDNKDIQKRLLWLRRQRGKGAR
ncbi:MAG: hypothetical protein DRH70_07995 [Candidatus Coatesbacteria bacterium]|nr:MAG: hypothetical protein DRH70_07995 [Candidatus Coatesbacteria bacterium]